MAEVSVLVEAITDSAEESLEEVETRLEDTGGAAEEAAGGMEDASGSVDDTSSSMDELGDQSSETSDSLTGVSESLFDVDAAGLAASGGIAAAGTAMQSLLDDTQEMRESLGRTAATTGMSREEMEELATSVSDATFPLDDATATMDELAAQGVTTEEDLTEVATAMDNVADATGSSAESISASMGPALRAFGQDLTDANEHMDTFTFVARNTTQDVEGFSSVVERLAPELQEMGLSLDETAAIMAALEEKGITGRQAIREFRQATREAEGDQAALKEELGLSEEAISEQEQALAEAEGTTVEHADAANESLTAMDELRNSFEEAKLQFSGVLEPLGALAPVLQALGVAGVALSTINFSAVAPSFAAVSASMAPITAIILGLVAVVGALAVAWDQNLGDIQGKTQELIELAEPIFEDLQDVIATFTEVSTELWAMFGDEIMAVADAVFGVVFTIIEQQLDVIITTVRVFLNLLTGDWQEALNLIQGFIQRTFGRYQELFNILKESISAVLNAIIGIFTGFINTGKEIILAGVNAYIGFWQDLFDQVTGLVGDLEDNTIGRFEDLKEGLVGIGEDIREFFIELWEDLKDAVPSADDLTPDLDDVPGSDIAGDVGGAVGDASSNLPGLQSGGTVQETGLAVVHEGETFIPEEFRSDSGSDSPQEVRVEKGPDRVEQNTTVEVDVAGDLDDDPFSFSRTVADQVTREQRRNSGT